MAKMTEDTPLIRQFFEVKAQHPEALLLYRVGDFYETYSDDAVTASRVLGLHLEKLFDQGSIFRHLRHIRKRWDNIQRYVFLGSPAIIRVRTLQQCASCQDGSSHVH